MIEPVTCDVGESVDRVVQRLRAGAKIDYLNKSMAPDAATTPPAAGSPAGGAVAGVAIPTGGKAADTGNVSNVGDKAALDRGVAGLK